MLLLIWIFWPRIFKLLLPAVMEYSVPAEYMKQVLMEVEACVRKHRFAVHFPVECRYVKGDDLWLSPAYGRDSAFIAVHMYKGMTYEAYFVV